MKTFRPLLPLLAAATVLGTASPALAVPETITFTARVTDAAGAPLEDADVQIHLEIFDAAEDGNAVWEETQTVAADDGLIYASLGAGVGAIFDGRPMFLELTIRDDTLAPRIPLASVPYAMRAEVATIAETLADFDPEGVITAVTPGAGLTGGGDAGAVSLSIDTNAVQARITGTCSTGFVTGVSATGQVTCANAQAGIGSVSASGGISATTSGGAVSLSIVAGGVTNTHLADGAVSEDKLGNGAVTETKLGNGAVTATKLGSNAVSSAKILDGEVKTEDLATDSVTMAKTSLPIGMFTGNMTTNSTNAIVLSGSVTLASAGSCLVHSWASISNGSTSVMVEPVMRRLATSTDILTGATVTGNGLDVQSTAVFNLTNSGDYAIGCKVNHFGNAMSTTYNCRASWTCN